MSNLNALLLQALTTSGTGGAMKDMLLSQLDSADPQTAILANYLKQQENPVLTAQEKVEDESILADKIKEMTKIIYHLKQRLKEIEQLHEENTAMYENVAAALGACYCLGNNPQCPDCHGQGHPGAFQPDVRLFRKFVLPAVQTLQQQKKSKI